MSVERLDILFVDDEERILDGLRRQLRSHRATWEIRYALSGAEALRTLAQRPADVVISDMRMPGMSGGQLLRQVQREYPQTTRIILSGQTDQSDLIRDLTFIHQYLQKPCEASRLCNAIERTCKLSRQLQQSNLRLAANRITALPPSSHQFQALVTELSKDDANIQSVAILVAADPALTAKLMQLVNSAFFGMPRRINGVKDAIILLGLKTLRSIVIASQMFDAVNVSVEASLEISIAEQQTRVEAIWRESVAIGEIAAGLAAADGAEDADQQAARLAGLLSLIGRAILLTGMPGDYAKIISTPHDGSITLAQREAEQFHASQDDVTAYSMGLWAFSDELVAAAANQSSPSRLPQMRPHHPAGYLHLARALHPRTLFGISDSVALDMEYLTNPSVAALIGRQRKIAA